MSNHTELYDRRLLYLRVKMLTQQFEELQQLRDRVRRAEAKAKGAGRRQRSWRIKRPTGCGPVRRGGRRAA